jgi:hypothetical protein
LTVGTIGLGHPLVEEHLARAAFEEERLDQPPVSAAIQYVVAEQGAAMRVYEAQES